MAEVAVTVYYDAACPFCVASMERVKRLDRAGRIEFVDLNTPEALAAAAPRFDAAALAEQMHVRMPNGTWRIGYEGWAHMMGALPGFAALAWLMKLPPVAQIGRPLYRWFAQRRYLVSKLLGLPAPCGTGAACPIGAPKTNAASPAGKTGAGV